MTDGPGASDFLASVHDVVAGFTPEIQALLVKVRAEIDGHAVALREAGWTPGQVGVLLLDNLLTIQGMPRLPAIVLAMELAK